MRVKTLDSHSSAPDSPVRADGAVVHGGLSAALLVLVVRSAEFFLVDQLLEPVYAALTLQATHADVQFRVDQPIESRHGRAVAQMGLVFDNDGPTVETSYDDGEAPGQRTLEQGFDDRLIVG